MKRKLSAALVFAMAALMTTTAALAAGIHFGVFDLMTTLFGQDGVLPEAQQLVASDLAHAELAHTTLTVEEAVYDGGNLRLVYSVSPKQDGMTAEEAAAADGVRLNGCDFFYINGEEYVMTNGSYSGSMPSAEGNRMLCYLDIYLASSGIVPEGDFSVSLPLIGMGKDVQRVTFTVPGYETADDTAAAQTDSVSVTRLSASLSPVRAYMRLRIERLPGVSAARFSAALLDWQDAYLVDAQGEKLSAPIEILTDAGEDGEWIELTYIFPPVDTDEVFFAPTVITPQNEWVVDMAHALPIH